MNNKTIFIGTLLFIIIVIMSFASLQSYKFYYAYNEKIYLNELNNKLIIRYKQKI
jgi:hypothetical protein